MKNSRKVTNTMGHLSRAYAMLNAKAPAQSTRMKTASPQKGTGKINSPSTEIGGPKGLDPTRYGDWERKGRCIDF